MKRNLYEAPMMQVLRFDAKDIITTSGFAGGEIPLGGNTAPNVSDEIF